MADELKARLTKVLARELAKPYCLSDITDAVVHEISEYAWSFHATGQHWINPFDLFFRPDLGPELHP